MSLSRRRTGGVVAIVLFLLLLGLSACGGANTPQAQTKPSPTPVAPTPTPGPGQGILNTMAQKLNTASTLHGVFNVKLSGTAFNGTINSEIWNAKPAKNRTVVLQSTVPQFASGSVTVTDGKQLWQYDPLKKVVYTGPVTQDSGTATPTTAGGRGGSQSQFILNIVQNVLTNSDGTLTSSSAKINGRDAYDVHVVPGTQSGAGANNFNYTGEVYIDKTTNLPLELNLAIQGFGNVVLDLPMLVLNQPLPDSTFTFIVPPGVKVLPLPKANSNSDTGSTTLDQAQQQAGYHLLSIPATQSGYVLGGVNALGAPGSQIFTLNYTKGSSSLTIAEGKSLANLPNNGGQQVNLRSTTGYIATTNGATTLNWTEKGVGLSITGNNLSKDQVVAIAQSLT